MISPKKTRSFSLSFKYHGWNSIFRISHKMENLIMINQWDTFRPNIVCSSLVERYNILAIIHPWDTMNALIYISLHRGRDLSTYTNELATQVPPKIQICDKYFISTQFRALGSKDVLRCRLILRGNLISCVICEFPILCTLNFRLIFKVINTSSWEIIQWFGDLSTGPKPGVSVHPLFVVYIE